MKQADDFTNCDKPDRMRSTAARAHAPRLQVVTYLAAVVYPFVAALLFIITNRGPTKRNLGWLATQAW